MIPEDGPRQRPTRVLLVEDDPADARQLEEKLAEAPLFAGRVDRVGTLEGALGRLRGEAGRPDAVLLDLHLPDSSGLDTLRSVVEAAPELPVVVLTGRDDREVALAALREQAADCLVKGEADPERLGWTLRCALERKHAIRELAAARRKLRLLDEHLEEVFYLWDFSTEPRGLAYCSAAYEEIWGRPVEEVVRDPVTFLEGIHPEDRNRVGEDLAAKLREKRHEEYRVVRPDGEVRWIRDRSYPVRDGSGEIRWVAGTAIDITGQKNTEEALRRSEARYRTLVETMAEATVILDREGRITFANEEAEELFGLEESRIQGRTYDDDEWRITAPDGGTFPEEELPFRRVVETGRPVRDVEHGIERPDGTRHIVSVNAAPLCGEDDELEGVVATIREVTDRHRMEQELRHRALHDPLTGLPNRTLFGDRLRQALVRNRRHGGLVGLLMLDLDRFKQINDRLGHAAGDRLLEEVAERIAAELREEDTAGRLGGDEFAVLLPGLGEVEELAGVRDRIMGALAAPYQLGGELVEVDVTLGGVLHGGEAGEGTVTVEEPDDLLRYADLALFEAKETPGPSFHLFRPEQASAQARVLGREQELRRAIREEEFELRWQPIYRLEDGALWGVEPLARWRHPERGLLPPAEFISLAEETGLIHDLGELLFRDVCRQAAAWPGGNGRAVRVVTSNLSGRQFDREGMEDTLLGIVEEAGLEPDRFWLEITETAVTRGTGKVERLRELGFGVFVDGFGSGHSSFQYLRDQRFDGLKIDMSFVHGLGREDRSAALVTTMIALGRAMEMAVVAGGIETEEQRATLVELGCELGQGYLLARPMATEEMAEALGE